MCLMHRMHSAGVSEGATLLLTDSSYANPYTHTMSWSSTEIRHVTCGLVFIILSGYDISTVLCQKALSAIFCHFHFFYGL